MLAFNIKNIEVIIILSDYNCKNMKKYSIFFVFICLIISKVTANNTPVALNYLRTS
jgi:hypothetical protein